MLSFLSEPTWFASKKVGAPAKYLPKYYFVIFSVVDQLQLPSYLNCRHFSFSLVVVDSRYKLLHLVAGMCGKSIGSYHGLKAARRFLKQNT